jgi:ribosome-associated translation inhibitor RaiA
MEITVRARGFEVTDRIRERIDRRIGFALDTFEDRVEEIAVHLEDLNGPRRGTDRLCQMSARVRGAGEFVVRETGASMTAAVNRAARRLKYRVSEALRRRAAA